MKKRSVALSKNAMINNITATTVMFMLSKLSPEVYMNMAADPVMDFSTFTYFSNIFCAVELRV